MYVAQVNHGFVNVPGLLVKVDNVMHVPGLETPSDKPYAFVYFLTIENNSTETVVIRGRKWIVRESNGECVIVEGEGVIGEKPSLNPGENFSYNSCHVIAEEAEARGSLFGRTASNDLFSVQIPEFTMKLPS